VLVVSAPVGYGATTAVAAALTDRPKVAWVGLEPLDAAPEVLAGQIALALTGDPSAAQAVSSDTEVELIGMGLLALAESGGAQWLVLDGLDARVHARALPLVGHLCANAATGLRIVITTHDSPHALPLPLLSGRVSRLVGADLALTPEETAALVLDSDAALSADVVDEVIALAQGWTAACRLAVAESARRGGESPGDWLRTVGVDQVTRGALATVSADGAQFLLETALLDELSGPLCDAALDSTGSADALVDLDLHGSLLVEVTSGPESGAAGHRRWKRHPLLTSGLRRMVSGRDLTATHRRAADWLRAEGDREGTMRHLLAAGDFEAASRYLILFENSLYESGQVLRAVTWYQTLPPEAWGEHGWNLVRAGWGRALTGDVRGAEVAVDQLRAHVAGPREAHPDRNALLGEASLLSSYLAAMRGDADAVVMRAARSIDLTDEHTPSNSQQLGPLMLVRGLLWRGDLDAVRAQLTRVEHQPLPTDILRESVLRSLQSRCLLLEGEVRAGTVTAQHALDWLDSQGLDPFAVAQFGLMTSVGLAHLEGGRLEQATSVLEQVVEAARSAQAVGEAVDALRWLARAHAAQGRLADAAAAIGEARHLLAESAPKSVLTAQVDEQEAWLRHLAGDNLRAERLVQGLPPGEDRSLLWARVTMPRQSAGAMRAVSGLLATTPRRAAARQVLLAQASVRRSTRLAEGHLVKAADIALDHGMALVFMGCDAELMDLAAVVGTRQGHDGLVELAEAARQGYGSGVAGIDRSPAPSLSPGEIQLLGFLPRRDTNADIARHLGVSVNTVKTRLQRLYRKLGVSTRDQAIAVARQRGLLP
jgi:LuxR family maltose regulon positive regulatory protein